FVCRPYMTPEVAFVANPDIWRAEHMVEEAQDPRPSAEYLRWWYLAGKRYLAPADAFHPRPPDEIPAEAFQRVAETPQATQVDDVPDNRRQDRRRMVGTRTTARDWQWLDQMMGEDDEVAAPRRVRLCLRVEVVGAVGEEVDHEAGPLWGRGSMVRAPAWLIRQGPVRQGPVMQGPVMRAPVRQGLVRIAGYPLRLSISLTAALPSEFDGSSRVSQMDLNEPASAPSQIFKAHAGTPPSAHVPDPYVLFSDPAPAPPPQDHALPITDADDGGAPRGRARR
ncbi:hypothetical protein PIB30_108777, partial [Stylosanthes scabra]|nr:hypothetical protein [Stylosanthes scabra]